MKKSLKGHFPTLFFLFLLIIGFCSCENQKEKKFKIGFSQCVTNDAWGKTMQEEMFQELSFYPDLGLEIKDAQGNNQLQIEQILEFQRQGVDLLNTIIMWERLMTSTAMAREIFLQALCPSRLKRNNPLGNCILYQIKTMPLILSNIIGY